MDLRIKGDSKLFDKYKKEPKKNSKPKKRFNAKPNLGYLFYKDYYRDIDFQSTDNRENKISFEQKSKELIDKRIYIQKTSKLESQTYFELKTTSMGLLTGSGHIHETSEEGEFKLGFEFDYTSGLPIVRGSSLKGVLRSAFPMQDCKECKKEGKCELCLAKEEYIKELLGEDLNNINIENLRDEIFEGKRDNKAMPLSKRDIFFDIEIIKGDKQNKTLSDEFITPHKNKLKNPIPIKFLKVSADVTFAFRFNLKDGLINARQKEELFKKIILDLGLGAKTNVGFGQFLEF